MGVGFLYLPQPYYSSLFSLPLAAAVSFRVSFQVSSPFPLCWIVPPGGYFSLSRGFWLSSYKFLTSQWQNSTNCNCSYSDDWDYYTVIGKYSRIDISEIFSLEFFTWKYKYQNINLMNLQEQVKVTPKKTKMSAYHSSVTLDGLTKIRGQK